jgi:tetratricopeptide (TPR) repeat protein
VVLGDTPDALTDEQVSSLRDAHSRIWELVHAGRYNELAPLVADLIPGLERAVRASASPGQAREAREMLSDTYQAVAAMLAKTGERDAAWIAADRAAFAAGPLADPLAVAASLFRMAHVFLSLGQLPQAQAVAGAAASGLDRQPDTTEVLSLRGAFRLVLAIAAARDNERTRAYAYLDQARAIAAQIGEDRNDFGTEFGPANVGLHAVAVAVELGDAGHALDLALAHSMRRQIGEALRYLKLAEELTPEQTRSHRVARAVARDLIQLSGPRVRPELRELAERFGVAS